MKLTEANLLRVLCAPLRNDETGIAFAKVLSPYLSKMAQSVQHALLLPNAANLPAYVLDELAQELHVPWYDFGAAEGVKQDLIAESDQVNMRLGTPASIEQVAISYFGTANVEEWWEYAAEPYHFRVRTGNISAVTENSEIFAALVELTKNLRSVYDGVLIDQTTPAVQATMVFCVQAATQMVIPMGGTV